jgi:hypothetical protein
MNFSKISAASIFVSLAVLGTGITSSVQAQQANMTFFVTSAGTGKGPWQNAKGAVVAKNVNELHSDKGNLNKQTALTEKGEMVKGRGDTPNQHDILTGSDPEGRFSTAGGDTTCGNWTKSGEGSAIVGHHDLIGLKDTRHMKSWNSSHGSRGCSQENLVATGGNGFFYCFAAN